MRLIEILYHFPVISGKLKMGAVSMKITIQEYLRAQIRLAEDIEFLM